MNRVEFAREFAVRAHGVQKYGVHPYSYHLDAVANICKDLGGAWGNTDYVLEVAYLHDVLEDTKISIETLAAIFGYNIQIMVSHITDPEGASRAIRKKLLNDRLAGPSSHSFGITLDGALLVKAADRLANLQACSVNNSRDMFMRYAEEHAEFRKACRRPGLGEEIWKQIDSLVSLVQ